MKVFLFFVIFFSGVIAGYSLQTIFEKKVEFTESFKNNRTKEVCISSIEQKKLALQFNELLELREQKDIFNKANDILGKSMLLFLANLSQSQKNKIASNFLQASKKCTEPQLVASSKTVKTSFHKVKKKTSKISMRPFEEVSLDISTQKMQKLQTDRIKNSFKLISDPDDLISLNGSFKGFLTITNRQDSKFSRKDNLDVFIDFKQEAEAVVGSYETILSYNEVKYSHNRGSGGNKALRWFDKSAGEFIMETSPSSFLQLKIINNNRLEGYHYNDNKLQGIVKLFRN